MIGAFAFDGHSTKIHETAAGIIVVSSHEDPDGKICAVVVQVHGMGFLSLTCPDVHRATPEIISELLECPSPGHLYGRASEFGFAPI